MGVGRRGGFVRGDVVGGDLVGGEGCASGRAWLQRLPFVSCVKILTKMFGNAWTD